MCACLFVYLSVRIELITDYDSRPYTVSFNPFYFRDNFPNCKPIKITFGRNIADKIGINCHMAILTYICCVSLVYIVK